MKQSCELFSVCKRYVNLKWIKFMSIIKNMRGKQLEGYSLYGESENTLR